MKLNEKSQGIFVSEDELVTVYQCTDGTWRVAYFPFSDKDRNLTKDEAFDLAEKRHIEALEVYAKYKSN